MEWYKKNNVKLMPKKENPPNCPELRVIEKYWAIMKRKMKKQKSFAETLKILKYHLKKHQIVLILILCASLWVPLMQKREILLDSHRNN